MKKEKPVDLSLGDQLPLGSRLRLARQQRDVRLSALARATGYDRGYLSHIENNDNLPSDEALAALAKELGITVEVLKEAPIEQFMQRRGTLELPASGIVYTSRERTAGQRVDRILAMAPFAKSTRRLGCR